MLAAKVVERERGAMEDKRFPFGRFVGVRNFEVVVENIGTVYDGPNGFAAAAEYVAYVGICKRGEGRVGNSVVLFNDGEIVKEFTNAVNEEEAV